MATAKPTQLIAYQQQKLSVKKPSVAVSPASAPSAKVPSKLRSPAQAVRESRNTNTAPVRGGGTICGGPGRGGSDRGAGFVQNRSLGSRSTNGFSGGVPPEDGDTGKTWEKDRVSYGPSRESFRSGRNGGLVNGNAGERFDPGRLQVRVYGRRSGIGRGFDVKRDGAGRGNWGAATDDFVARESKEGVNLNEKALASEKLEQKEGIAMESSNDKRDSLNEAEEKEPEDNVYIIGGDGTQKGASVIFEEIRRRGLKVDVVDIPMTIDNDIAVIDKSFGFDTAVEEAQRAINASHVEAESIENGIGVVKLMGRYSGFIAMHATLASRDVDCCLIPESPFYLEGKGGLLDFVEKRLKENGHMVLVVAEGAGQELIAESMRSMVLEDASGNKALLDVGLWLSQKIEDHFSSKKKKTTINLKYIDPTYMIRAIPSNASDNVYCTLLAHSAIHGALAGYTGFTVGPVNGRHAYIPLYRVTETQNKVVITDRMWARLLSSTNQPSFLCQNDLDDGAKKDHTPFEFEYLEGENFNGHYVESASDNGVKSIQEGEN